MQHGATVKMWNLSLDRKLGHVEEKYVI